MNARRIKNLGVKEDSARSIIHKLIAKESEFAAELNHPIKIQIT